jgi:hypothetical protein
MFTEHVGKQFPQKSQVISWNNLGVETHVPFISSDIKDMVRLDPTFIIIILLTLIYQDKRVVQSMASLSSAHILQPTDASRDIHRAPIAVTLVHPDAAGEMHFVERVREHLGNNQAVIVKGWKPQREAEFSCENFKRRGYILQQPVQYQGKKMAGLHNDNELTKEFRCKVTN